MLLEFRATNYKSFKDEFVFSLIPAQKQKGLDYSILKQKIGGKTYKGLCSAVIYGPNAAGKTNIIGAMETFKEIVLRGNIRNDQPQSPNISSGRLELIPNFLKADNNPVTFSIKFISEGTVIVYSFSAELGKFFDKKDSRKILSESLCVNEVLVFDRGDSFFVNTQFLFNKLGDKMNGSINEYNDSATALAENSLTDEELFLTNGFKTIYSKALVSIITNWLEKNFLVIYHADAIYQTRKLKDSSSIEIDEMLTDVARELGNGGNELGFAASGDDNKSTLCSFLEDGRKVILLPSEIFESYGTIRFVHLFPIIVSALQQGGTLVVDEFDASLHPMVLMNIINIFHNDEINIHHAQLVFNTHNPIFLNSNLFRRDEIKFVERDEESGCSQHYSLSDFGTDGKNGVRKNEDFMKNYFVDRYGAIRDIDFTPIFERLIKKKDEK